MAQSREMLVCNLLVSLLAVNKWSVERVLGLLDSLRSNGLTNCDAVARMSVAQVADLLDASGYARGEYLNGLLAQRVVSLCTTLTAAEVAALDELVKAGDCDQVERRLWKIEGVGPTVLKNFWVLMDQSGLANATS